jgi:hypothetical protein
MTEPITGGCLCGALRYECGGAPVGARVCHCRDCQKATGSAFSSNLVMREEAFRLTAGEVEVFDVVSARGNTVSRAFCPRCGSPVFGRSTGFPGLVTVRAGSLDDPGRFRPEVMFYTSSAVPWVHVDGDLPHYPKMPDS